MWSTLWCLYPSVERINNSWTTREGMTGLTGLFDTQEGLLVADDPQVVGQVSRGAAPLPQKPQQHAARAALQLQHLQGTQLHLLRAGDTGSLYRCDDDSCAALALSSRTEHIQVNS